MKERTIPSVFWTGFGFEYSLFDLNLLKPNDYQAFNYSHLTAVFKGEMDLPLRAKSLDVYNWETPDVMSESLWMWKY